MAGGEIEVFLDQTPGETRGVILRDGRAEHLLIEREGTRPETRLGARSVARIDRVEPSLKGAFATLAGGAVGFLALRKGEALTQGQKVEVEVRAEPREAKGPTLRLIGPGQGDPRLLVSGPTLAERLQSLAPGIAIHTGADAIQAGWDAEEEALAGGVMHRSVGLDLAIQRTRALVAVDLDYAPPVGRDARSGRQQANLLGLRETARLVRLRQWGGLVAIDLIGTGQDAEPLLAAARQAFTGDPEIVIGPLNRFGVLMLSIPWHWTPLDAVLLGPDGRRSLDTRALDVVRRLRFALLTDTRSPRLIARCRPDEAERAADGVAELGPRAHLRADDAVAPGRCVIEEA